MRVWIAGVLGLAGCGAAPSPHPIAPAAAPSSESRESADRSTEGQPDSHHVARQTRRAIGWVAIAVGAESAAVATVTSFMMLHQNSVRSDGCTQKTCSPSGLVANQQLDQLAGWNAASWALGAAGLGVGVVLLLTNPSDKAIHAEVGATPSGAFLQGTF